VKALARSTNAVAK